MNARSWLQDVREHADPHLTCILVGNKVDLCSDEGPTDPNGEVSPAPVTREGSSQPGKRKREVSTEEAELWAQEEGLLFVETSARSGLNVEMAFERATRDILEKVRKGEFDEDRVSVGPLSLSRFHHEFDLSTFHHLTVSRSKAITAYEERWVNSRVVCSDVTMLLICSVMVMCSEVMCRDISTPV